MTDTVIILTGYLIIAVMLTAIIILAASQLKETIIHKKGIYPDDVNIYLRASGLRIKELKRVQESVKDDEVKSKVGQVIYLRKLGFRLLLSVPFLWIALMIFQMLVE